MGTRYLACVSGDGERCLIPHGAKGFDKVYEIVSKYEGFDFTNFGKSMTCADNAEFDLWVKGKAHINDMEVVAFCDHLGANEGKENRRLNPFPVCRVFAPF